MLIFVVFFYRNGSVNVMLMFLMTKGILGDLLTALNKSHSEKGIEFPMSLSNIFSKESRSRLIVFTIVAFLGINKNNLFLL